MPSAFSTSKANSISFMHPSISGIGSTANSPKRPVWSRAICAANSLHSRAILRVCSGFPNQIPGAEIDVTAVAMPSRSMMSRASWGVHAASLALKPGAAAAIAPAPRQNISAGRYGGGCRSGGNANVLPGGAQPFLLLFEPIVTRVDRPEGLSQRSVTRDHLRIAFLERVSRGGGFALPTFSKFPQFPKQLAANSCQL